MLSVEKVGTASKQGNGRDHTPFATGVSRFAHQAEERLGGAVEIVKTVVTNRPVLALGAAVAAGVFLGWLIKRR